MCCESEPGHLWFSETSQQVPFVAFFRKLKICFDIFTEMNSFYQELSLMKNFADIFIKFKNHRSKRTFQTTYYF